MALSAAAYAGGKASPSGATGALDFGPDSSKRRGLAQRILQLPRTVLRSIRGGWTIPFFVPAVQPIELFFFQRIFDNLCEQLEHRKMGASAQAEDPAVKDQRKSVTNQGRQSSTASTNGLASKFTTDLDKIEEVREVPLVQFHRAMVRLFKILQQPNIDVLGVAEGSASADANGNGKVGWYEFCSFWKEHRISVQLTFAERVFLTLEDAERSIVGRFMSVIVFIAIVISTGCFVISTVPAFQSKCILQGDPGHDPACKPKADDTFKDVDIICVTFFCVEYGLRLVLSGVMRLELVDRDKQKLLEWMVSEETMRPPSFLRRVSEWFFSPANLIDLAAIMPWFLTKAFEETGGGDSFIIRFIRLTRVIRAIRLGKRFEAVIIVVRSVRRSIRALYVLVLNLVLGVITFGALMYFCEQGAWDKERKAYMRLEGEKFNEATRTWDNVYGRSPFDSIPACFWWAIVTATTVGYGDMYPTTTAGKAVAGLAMGWSLCVLALPIGVIGNNFSNVWREYDKEKETLRVAAVKEEMMLKRSIAWGDPLHYSRRIVLEVWHDPGLSDDDQAEFMGEVDWMLDMPPKECVGRKFTIPLTPNFDKARRRVRGQLTFEYSWRPHLDVCGVDALLTGALEITVLMGEDLISIDWKGTCSSDPYCVVVAYPRSPGPDGKLFPICQRGKTEWDTSNPKWEFKAHFDVHWTRAGTAQCLETDMRQLGEETGGDGGWGTEKSQPNLTGEKSGTPGGGPRRSLFEPKQAAELTEQDKQELLENMVPSMQEEIVHLQKCVVPQLQSSIYHVQQDLHLIANALRKRGLCKSPDPDQGLIITSAD